jgi:hypothetical protein
MRLQLAVTWALATLSAGSFGVAIYHERRMQRHRQPGVGYREVTLRRDGGWRRTDLFTPAGLAHQRQASRFGLLGIVLALASLIAWVALAFLSAAA